MEELTLMLSLVKDKGLTPAQAGAELGRTPAWVQMVINSDAWKFLGGS